MAQQLLEERAALEAVEDPRSKPEQEEAGRTRTPLRKASVALTEDEFNLVDEMAERRGISLSQAIRQCIATEAFLEKAQREGGEILIRRGKVIERVVFR